MTHAPEQYSDNVELTTPSRTENSIYPDSDAFLLQRHRDTQDSDDDSVSEPSALVNSTMSLTPLLAPSHNQPAGNYSTVPPVEDSSRDHGRRRNSGGRRGSISDSRKSLRKNSLDESFTSGVEMQAGQGKMPEGFAPLMEEIDDEDDAIIDVDGPDNKHSDTNPPDNSMCVDTFIKSAPLAVSHLYASWGYLLLL